MYLCIYLGSFFDILHAKSLQRKNHLLIPLQTKSILILDLNFVQKFQIISIRLPKYFAHFTNHLCAFANISFEFSKKTHAAFFPQKFHKEEEK
jgi:hypothetical protein